MKYSNLTKKFIFINLVLFICLVGGLYSYDPLHIYHKSWLSEKDYIHGDMRRQAAGIINNYDFDSIILGTSMMKGSSSILYSQKLGGDFVNLSANAASIYERKYILSYVLKKKIIKNVVYSFDTALDLNLKKSDRKVPVKKFEYLYDDNPFNDLKVYWNIKYIKCLFILSTTSECFGYKREVQRPLAWFEKTSERNRKISGIENWVHNVKGRGKAVHSRVQRHLKRKVKKGKEFEDKLQKTHIIVEESLLTIVKENKKVNFSIIFPPYSRFLYSLWKKEDHYKYLLYIETIKLLVKESGKYKNLDIYSFDELDYLDELNNYRDMRHYNRDMNEMMLDAIKSRKNIITNDNLNDFIARINKLNEGYPLLEELSFLLDYYK